MSLLNDFFSSDPAEQALLPHGFLELFSLPDAVALDARSLPLIEPCAKVFNENFIYFCQRNIPTHESLTHMLVTGATGAGKTIAINGFIKSLEDRFRPGREKAEQLIFYDAKGDGVPFLAALGYRPEDKDVYLLHPFDERGVVWMISEAVQEPAMAWYLACVLVPEEKNSTAPFFSDAARLLVFAVILGLNARRGTNWTLRDLLCALDSRKHIKAVCSHHPESEAIAEPLLKDKKHSPGVIASIATKIRKFAQVAALWASYENPKQLSITEFFSRPGVLIIGNDPVLNDSIKPLVALMVRVLTDETLRGDETLEPRRFFIFDEFNSMGSLEDSVPKLLEMGRSKGASVMIGVQSVAGMVALYGEANANKIFGLCAHKQFLRAGEPQTARWAEEFFGKVRHVEQTFSETHGKGGSSSTVQYATQDRPLLLASSFLNLPYPKPGRLFRSISDVPSLNRVIVSARSFDEILSWRPKPVDVPAIIRRTSIKDQTLWPWSKEEEEEFCPAPVKPPVAAPEQPSVQYMPIPYLPKRRKRDDPRQGQFF